jgi:iron complex transport system ATP-binding protein
MIALNELSIGYQTDSPLCLIEAASVAPGQVVSIVGRNGSGKSTLLKTIAGQHAPLAGQVRVGTSEAVMHKRPPTERAQACALVMSGTPRVEHLTVYELIAMGRHPHTGWSGRMSDDDHAVVRDVMAELALTPLSDRPLNALSDGQRQKVMIARALAQRAPALLLDEPTAYLDWPARRQLMSDLVALTHRRRQATVLTTHELDLALAWSDQIWVLGKTEVHPLGCQVCNVRNADERIAARQAMESVFGPLDLSM